MLYHLLESIIYKYCRNSKKVTKPSIPKKLHEEDAVEIGYLMEANTKRAHDNGNNYNLWDIFDPNKFTFNASGGANLADPRSLPLEDQQHLGKMNMTYFDGHTAPVRLKVGSFTYALLNPHL
jgi:prepilin-type processing-associated H-X9-DG protein